jgi:hypothetical protein
MVNSSLSLCKNSVFLLSKQFTGRSLIDMHGLRNSFPINHLLRWHASCFYLLARGRSAQPRPAQGNICPLTATDLTGAKGIMKIYKLGVQALAGLAFLAASGAASAITCDNGSNSFTVDPATACASVPKPPDNSNDDYPTGNTIPDALSFNGMTFDWTGIDKDESPDTPGNPETALVVTNLGGTSGTFTVDTTGLGYGNYLLFLKASQDAAAFLLDLSQAVNGVLQGTWSIAGFPTGTNPNGLSHMSLYGEGTDQDVPEPGTLALLGLGLCGLGLARRRKV